MKDFSDFCDILLRAGFSMGGGSAKGIYAVVPYGWDEQDGLDVPVKWFSEDPETDPWQWRVRVLEERDDIAYGKFFFRVSGYITKAWYPLFYAVRRQGLDFADAYASGTISRAEKRIYDILEGGEFAYHEIKRLGGFRREDAAAFDRAIVSLQMRMFITPTGFTQRVNKYGEPYGWDVTVFSRAEDFWAQRGFAIPDLDPDESFDAIREQILALNPGAKEKDIVRFIRG